MIEKIMKGLPTEVQSEESEEEKKEEKESEEQDTPVANMVDEKTIF
jgi:hypothetical protein